MRIHLRRFSKRRKSHSGHCSSSSLQHMKMKAFPMATIAALWLGASRQWLTIDALTDMEWAEAGQIRFNANMEVALRVRAMGEMCITIADDQETLTTSNCGEDTSKKTFVKAGNTIKFVGAADLCITSVDLTPKLGPCSSSNVEAVVHEVANYQSKLKLTIASTKYCLEYQVPLGFKLTACAYNGNQAIYPQAPEVEITSFMNSTFPHKFTLSISDRNIDRYLSDANPEWSMTGEAVVFRANDALRYNDAQWFTYDLVTRQVRSWRKNTRCLGTKNSVVVLVDCDASDASQKFKYAGLQGFVSHSDASKCLTAKKAFSAWVVEMAQCASASGSDSVQAFSTLSMYLWDSNVPALPSPPPVGSEPYFNGGGDFVLRSTIKTDLCWGINSHPTVTDKVFALAPCGSDLKGQTFRKVAWALMHVDTSAYVGVTSDSSSFKLVKFSESYGVFVDHMRSRLAFSASLSSSSLCLDYQGSWGQPNAKASTLKTCDETSLDQNLIAQTPTSSFKAAMFSRPEGTVFKICLATNTELCLADSSAEWEQEPSTPPKFATKDALLYPEASWFVYSQATGEIGLWRKPGIYLRPAQASPFAWSLKYNLGMYEKFVYNDVTKMLARWTARDMCMDAYTHKGKDEYATTEPCQFTSTAANYEYQRFTLVEVTEQQASQRAPKPLRAPGTRETLFYSGAEFAIRSFVKTDLCLALDPSWDDTSKLRYEPCDVTSDTQIFTHSKWQLNHKATGKCVNRGMDAATASAYSLDTCSPSNPPVRIDGDLHITLGTGSDRLCLDDQGGWGRSTDTGVALSKCSGGSYGQYFFAEASPGAVIGAALFVTPSVFQICLAISPKHCVGDTMVDVAVQSSVAESSSVAAEYALRLTTKRFKPYLEATWFTYDMATHQLRSWGRRSLCVTRDAVLRPSSIQGRSLATSGSTAGVWVLAACDSSSPAQKFVYNDRITWLSPYDDRDMCLDGGIGWEDTVKTLETTACRIDEYEYQSWVLVEKTHVKASDPGTVTTKCAKSQASK